MENKVEYIISLKDLFLKQIKEDEKAVDSFESKFNKVTKLVAGGLAVTGIWEFAKGVTEVGAKFESYEAGLATLLKSKEQAHDVFNQIKEDAKATPFDTESLVVAERALISTGKSAEVARRDTMNLANAIVAVGGTSENLSSMAVNMQQISNTGKASALDIKQFAFAGINIYEILAQQIFNTSKASQEQLDKVKQMDISYDLLSASLARAAGAGGAYENALQNASESMQGQLSNLDESITFLKVDLYESLRPAIAAVVSGLAQFVSMVRSAIQWSREHSTLVKSIAIGLGTIVLGVLAYNAAVAIAALATQAWTVAQMLLNGAMALNPIGLVIIGIGLLVGAIVYAWNKFEGFRGSIVGVWDMMKEFVKLIKEDVINMLTGLGDIIQGVFTLDADKINKGLKATSKALLDTSGEHTKRLASAFNKGYDRAKGMAWDNPIDGLAKQASALSGPGEEVTAGGLPGSTTSTASKVSSVKPTQINITIGSLIKDGVNITSANISESASKIREIIAEELMKAVNDSQRIAGI